MNKSIRLYKAVSDKSSQRINAFPGRNLSEHAFDLMQAHVDQRVDPLLGAHHPGIVEGLQLTTHSAGKTLQMYVQPGTALGADGRAIRVFFPIELDWEALISAHRQANDEPEINPNGYYFLTVRRMAGIVEDDPVSKPCTRDQLDPLRDSRVETYATLDLQYITDLSNLRSMSQRRAVNNLCVRFLKEPVFNPETGAVPLAIAFIDEGTPQWVETIGGRFLAQENAPYQAFAAHWEHVLESVDAVEPIAEAEKTLSIPGSMLSAKGSLIAKGVLNSNAVSDLLAESNKISLSQPSSSSILEGAWTGVLTGKPSSSESFSDGETELHPSLREALGVDYMPAAGRFPSHLIGDIAGYETEEIDEETEEERNAWALPEMVFEENDLQIEMLPIPASTALGVIRRELPRGMIDLVHHQADRLRLLVAVEDRDYRPDLMVLPEVDYALIEELYERAQTAMEAEHEWAYASRELYALLDEDPYDDEGKLSEETRLQFKGTYLPPTYSTHCDATPDSELPYKDYLNIRPTDREALGIPDPVCPVRTPGEIFSEMRIGGTGRPYSNTSPDEPDGYDPPIFDEVEDPGLYRQKYVLDAEVENLEEMLETNHDLIDEVNDFLSVQRQHLDAITTNFAALAGGVAGDGSGLRLMRWNNALQFQPLDLAAINKVSADDKKES